VEVSGRPSRCAAFCLLAPWLGVVLLVWHVDWLLAQEPVPPSQIRRRTPFLGAVNLHLSRGGGRELPRAQWGGGAAWQVHFAQRADRPWTCPDRGSHRKAHHNGRNNEIQVDVALGTETTLEVIPEKVEKPQAQLQ
jgi:hypothetical protein